MLPQKDHMSTRQRTVWALFGLPEKYKTATETQFEMLMAIPMSTWPTYYHRMIMSLLKALCARGGFNGEIMTHMKDFTHWKKWIATFGLQPNMHVNMEEVWERATNFFSFLGGSTTTWFVRLQLLCRAYVSLIFANQATERTSGEARCPPLMLWNVTGLHGGRSAMTDEKLACISRMCNHSAVAVCEHKLEGTMISSMQHRIQAADFYSVEGPSDGGINSVGLFLPRHLGWYATQHMTSLVGRRAGLITLRRWGADDVTHLIVAHFPNTGLQEFFQTLQVSMEARGLTDLSENENLVLLADANAVASHEGRSGGVLTYHDITFSRLFQKHLAGYELEEITGPVGARNATWRPHGERQLW